MSEYFGELVPSTSYDIITLIILDIDMFQIKKIIGSREN